MSRKEVYPWMDSQRFPRVSGDEPAVTRTRFTKERFSPRERG